mmetsp:Transcript_73237/g.214706  ORF Transcript_73237/g.214706 Transcript_73237/m.214706 type:complete len:2127 (-) Transcript_73237:286-6666(-)
MGIILPDDARSRFGAALQEHNFGKRCHLLASIGRELQASALEPEPLEALLDSLVGDPSVAGPAFAEKARLIVAKSARCIGYSKKLLDHPSHSVRFEAVRGGLLSPADAREAFLASKSSRKLKQLLIGYGLLPSDREVLDHAWQLFGAQDKELVWELLTRVTDEQLLKSWLLVGGREEMTEWLGDRMNSCRPARPPPGLPQLARRFPHTMVELVRQGTLRWSWYWMKDVLQADPALVLRTAFLEGHRQGCGPRKGYDPGLGRQTVSETLASWGWRHQPDWMLEICREHAEKKASSKKEHGESMADDLVQNMAKWLMEVTSTRYYLTTGQKLNYLMSIWSCIPLVEKTASMAHAFVKLLPAGLCQNRTKDLQQLVDAFWKILSEVGRATRKELLVGKDPEVTCTEFLKTLLRKLPAPLAVEHFFRVLEEFEADSPAYEFVQSKVCKSLDGRYDGLMQRVFGRYLQKDGLNSVQAANMFQVLLKDARLMDVIQGSFDLLIQRLDDKMEIGLMQKVVLRMKELEKKSRLGPQSTSGACASAATLPVPVHWVRLVLLPRDVAPHADFLIHVLNTDHTTNKELLGSVLARYGPSFFWDALEHVLSAASPTGRQLLEQAPLPPNMDLFKQIDIAGVLKPMEQRISGTAPQTEAVSRYFAMVSDTKKKTLGKDPSQRQAGYAELMSLAQKERDPSKAFEDLLPFLVGRFSGEQEGVRIAILKGLLEKKLLPFKLWVAALPHLQSLWKICSKSRESSSYTALWHSAGSLLVDQALRDWTDSAEPSAVCAFGVEISGELDLPAKFVKLQKECEEGKSLSDAAIRWIFETAVPLSSDTGIPISVFWTTLQQMAEVVPKGKGAERALWERWPFVAARWRALLAQGVKQKAVQFALIDVVDILTKRSAMLAIRISTGEAKPWWEPLECAEYKDAVSSILGQMRSGEIPAREASSMLALRVRVLVTKAQQSGDSWKVRGRKRRARVETQNETAQMRAQAWVANERWDIPKHHLYTPLPWETYRCTDAVASAEVDALSKLLASGRAQRQVLWRIVEVASLLSGPGVSDLVGEAVATLDARLEGMARSIARHYPYLNSALTKGEKQDGSPDVLTPLLELWLFDDSSRDACVGRIMKRGDFEYFLFFGTSFARHVSNARQEWLHLCLQKLQAPGVGGVEFYHYARRGPVLYQVAHLGSASPGWRSTLCGVTDKKPTAGPSRREVLALRRKGKGKGKGKGRGGRAPQPASSSSTQFGSVQMYLWHPDTQAQFLEKALCSTDARALALLPRLEYADGLAHSSRVLQSCPKEQTVAESATDIWGWEVIQAAGAYSDLKVEIEHRFAELPAPWICDEFKDPEKECVIAALGRASDAAKGLHILGQYAGKVKGVVKESVTKLISQVNPVRARKLIHDVMLPRKSGVGLQVAGLRKIVELQIPDPLELYRTAWSNGKCPRDVAGIILAKVNTAQSFSPDDVRGFFEFFSQMAGQQDECIYVAGLLVDQLVESPAWSLPFLPGVVARLALLPGMTARAVQALAASTSHATEVVGALSEVLRSARLAARAPPSVAKDSPEAQTLKDLSAITSFSSLRDLARRVSLLRLESCEPLVLKGFVAEVLSRWEDAARARDANKDSLLECVLAIWAKLLRPGETATWPSVLESMEKRLARRVPGPDFSSGDQARRGWPQALGILARAVAAHVPHMSPGREGAEAALAAAGDFFERLLDEHLNDQDAPQQQVDNVFKAEMQERSRTADEILVKCWAGLLARGCPKSESARLFARCPERLRLDLVKSIVTKAVNDTKEQTASRAQWRQKRPEEGWRHSGGIPVEDVTVGSKVDGVVTNSSAMHGVFFNFGCVKDGKLNVPTADWKKYHVGDEVKGMIVNKVDIGANNQFIELILMSEGGVESSGAFHPCDVAQRALAWLSSPPEQRDLHFATLAELWASVVALDQGGLSFDASLALLGTPPPVGCVRLVLDLLGHRPAKALTRQALTWLGQVSPEDAVQLWPALLTPSAGKKDVEALLALCEANALEPPELPQLVAQDLSDEVLGVLAASSIPSARLIVIQALGERHCSFDDLPPVLEALCGDPCEVVTVAARNLWVGLRDTTEKSMKEVEKMAEEDDSEVDESEEAEDEVDDSESEDY